MPSPTTATLPGSTRPRNRRQLIVEAAGRAFNDRGYHAASMEEIAADVGITAAALYRHFPSKYRLFVECVNLLADRLVDTLDGLPEETPLAEALRAVTTVTVDHRATGGVYRWEARYLEGPERRRLRAKFARVVAGIAAAVRAEAGPDVAAGIRDADTRGDGSRAGTGRDALRATAALGAIGSITLHRTALARRRLDDTLVEAALRVATGTDRPAVASPATDIPEVPVPRTRRAEILAAAIPLFEQEGFTTVTIGAIAQRVGLTPSALYRHYPGKVDILAAACLQAAALLDQSVSRALEGVDDPGEAVSVLARTYVAYSFEHRALTSVAEAEIIGLPEELRTPLVLAQREHIAVWEDHLRAARPALDARQARVLVHAGFGVVVEAGRWLRWEDTQEHRALLSGLLLDALGVAG
ncbi:MAG: TetR/AcrR family transcriptional regulator [Actinomycetales bacterium]|nr:TetR/AcrR family transcriptional regulator [Actinomycetales bacterium]